MKARPLRVVKVGGSLLTFVRLRETLQNWLAEQTPAVNVLVPGGGAAADAVRDASRRFGLEEEQSHWLAVEAMSLSARLLHALLPEAAVVTALADMNAAEDGTLLIVDPLALLRNEENELGPERLPHTWAATSDSIAARIAQALEAEELVLLKSSPPPADPSWQKGADAGYVDGYFPVAAARLRRVRAVNLRDAHGLEAHATAALNSAAVSSP